MFCYYWHGIRALVTLATPLYLSNNVSGFDKKKRMDTKGQLMEELVKCKNSSNASSARMLI